MFARESDMTSAVVRWMESGGMTVKSQFVTPWGICDLVGLTFNPTNVARRLEQKQTRPVGSITRALLLLQIPDTERGTSTTVRRLVRQFAPSIPEEVVSEQVAQLIGDRFVVPSSRGRLQKVNGWMPLQDRLVAVELKLSRIDEAMYQARGNLGFAQESYVAFPAEVARRVAASRSRWSGFFGAGVGLLSVTRRGCEVLVDSRPDHTLNDEAIQFYCVEKFWRTRLRDS